MHLGLCPRRGARVSPTFRAALVQAGRNPSLDPCTPGLADGQRLRRTLRLEPQPN